MHGDLCTPMWKNLDDGDNNVAERWVWRCTETYAPQRRRTRMTVTTTWRKGGSGDGRRPMHPNVDEPG